jgi:hypothetical protein
MELLLEGFVQVSCLARGEHEPVSGTGGGDLSWSQRALFVGAKQLLMIQVQECLVFLL